MLFTLEGERISHPHEEALWQQAISLLGEQRTESIRGVVDGLIDAAPRGTAGSTRTFTSRQLGAPLEPWPYPLASLYDISLTMLGDKAKGREIYTRAWDIFSLFIWDAIERQKGRWVVDGDLRSLPEVVYRELHPSSRRDYISRKRR